MLRRFGYRTKGHLQHCTSFRRGFHGSSTGSSTELSSSTSSSSTVVHESLPVGLPCPITSRRAAHHAFERRQSRRMQSTIPCLEVSKHGEMARGPRPESAIAQRHRSSARQCRGRERASWPPRGLQRATAGRALFLSKSSENV